MQPTNKRPTIDEKKRFVDIGFSNLSVHRQVGQVSFFLATSRDMARYQEPEAVPSALSRATVTAVRADRIPRASLARGQSVWDRRRRKTQLLKHMREIISTNTLEYVKFMSTVFNRLLIFLLSLTILYFAYKIRLKNWHDDHNL